MLKTKNTDKNYPSNTGVKWTIEEDNTLLKELDENIDIEIIAQKHNRTIGGITARQQTIAYDMYLKKSPIEEIIIKTKLDKNKINEIITKKENTLKKVKTKPINISLEDEIIKMRNEIKELKTTVSELVDIIKSNIFFNEDINNFENMHYIGMIQKDK